MRCATFSERDGLAESAARTIAAFKQMDLPKLRQGRLGFSSGRIRHRRLVGGLL